MPLKILKNLKAKHKNVMTEKEIKEKIKTEINKKKTRPKEVLEKGKKN